MIYTDLSKKALKLCFEVHSNQIDKSGMPYVYHPFHLAEQMTDEATTVVALLHDVLEDSDLLIDDLSKMGLSKEMLEAIILLTHDKAVTYMEYIHKIAENPIARTVKLADLRHNSDLTRLDVVTDSDISRCKRYQKAINFLEERECHINIDDRLVSAFERSGNVGQVDSKDRDVQVELV